MNTKKVVLYLYAESPVHAGTGTGLGAVDLPIQREKHTGYPIIQASSVKGALRNTAEPEMSADQIRAIFGGTAGSEGDDFASAMSPSDARILLFPVRALKGVFIWITAPTVLARFAQDTGFDTPSIPDFVNKEDEPVLVSDQNMIVNGQIMLEEYAYAAAHDVLAEEWANHLAHFALRGADDDYWKTRLRTHLAILPDDEFRDFARYATEIVTRIHLDDVTKVVKDGQLFTQELLPADSVLYSLVHITDSREAREKGQKPKIPAHEVFGILYDMLGERLQIGADETVGRGRVRLNWQEVTV